MRATEFLVEKKVQSTWITDVRYNRPQRILTMTLSNGRQFLIPGASRQTFERWIGSPSKGRFFHEFIKGQYPINRVK